MKLHEIGLKHKTDKALYHYFTEIYDPLLEKFIGKNINFMEIGVEYGFSLKMWDEFFQNANIFGVDILDKSFLNSDRIKTIIVNQEHESELMSLPNNMDIILDDGGHTMLQQQVTFKTLFNNKLKSGGYYILEDLHTSNERYYNTHGSNEKNNTLKLIQDFKKGSLSNDNQYYINQIDFITILDKILSVEIYEVKPDSITSLIIKK